MERRKFLEVLGSGAVLSALCLVASRVSAQPSTPQETLAR